MNYKDRLEPVKTYEDNIIKIQKISSHIIFTLADEEYGDVIDHAHTEKRFTLYMLWNAYYMGYVETKIEEVTKEDFLSRSSVLDALQEIREFVENALSVKYSEDEIANVKNLFLLIC